MLGSSARENIGASAIYQGIKKNIHLFQVHQSSRLGHGNVCYPRLYTTHQLPFLSRARKYQDVRASGKIRKATERTRVPRCSLSLKDVVASASEGGDGLVPRGTIPRHAAAPRQNKRSPRDSARECSVGNAPSRLSPPFYDSGGEMTSA